LYEAGIDSNEMNSSISQIVPETQSAQPNGKATRQADPCFINGEAEQQLKTIEQFSLVVTCLRYRFPLPAKKAPSGHNH